MATSIPLLNHLNFIDFENNLGIEFETIYQFLQDNRQPQESALKKFNVKREFDSYEHAKVADTDVYRFNTFVRYIYKHCDDFKICRKISDQICNLISKKSQGDCDTNLNLYKKISKGVVLSQLCESDYLSKIKFNEEQLKFLQRCHKELFSSTEWKNICFFEHHFQQVYGTEAKELSVLIKQKQRFLNDIEKSGHVGNILHDLSKNVITRRNARHHAAKKSKEIKLFTNSYHDPLVMESALFGHLSETFGEEIEQVVCVDCDNSCRHSRGIHTFIQMSAAASEHLDEIASTCRYVISSQHSSYCPSVLFLQPGSILSDSDGPVCRFQLRDYVFYGKLKDHIIFNSVSGNEYEVDTLNDCQGCHIEDIKPLHWDSFDIFEEWYLDVPLIVQNVLAQFVNPRSVKKSKDVENLLKSKTEALYSCYDRLLSIFNRNHLGILQQRNTEELSLNYRSITSVFSITSDSGTTISLRESERRLRESISGDLCYYNTFICRYPFTYTSLAGEILGHVSLRDCILIFMLDNLVRLQYHKDPHPGENRSNQLCTLPMTVKGLPKDAIETESWHDDVICNGTNECDCRQRKKLEKEEGKSAIFDLTKDEETVEKAFNKLCNWAVLQSWSKLSSNSLLQSHLKSTSEDAPQSENAQMETSNIDTDEETESDDSTDSDLLLYAFDDEVDLEDSFMALGIDEDDNDEKEMNEDDFDLANLFKDTDRNGTLHSVSMCTPLDHTTKEDDRTSLDVPPSNILETFGFKEYIPPPLLCRHPPPATGRDDDLVKLKQILDDFILKSGNQTTNPSTGPRILFAPDQKIGKNLLTLMETNEKYQLFLPEFPLLHLRKSKITNLFSGYNNAGLLQILQYLKGDIQKEWGKLISDQNIEKATRMVWRISMGLHLAFIVSYLQTLPLESAEELKKSWNEKCNVETPELHSVFDDFLQSGSRRNASFALHVDIMKHCDEVLAVSLAERLGGTTGYDLLLVAVKRSLPFAFLNGAASYGVYTTKLLQAHYEAGMYHQHMKKTLFSTRHKHGSVNFGLDAQREMDHRDVVKAFRSGGKVTSVIPRMSLIDNFNEAENARSIDDADADEISQSKKHSWKLTSTDEEFVLLVAELVLRRGGLSTETCDVPFNMYTKEKTPLTSAILDKNSKEIGNFLVLKYICQDELFGHTSSDLPKVEGLEGSKTLLNKVKNTKSTTINRSRLQVDNLDTDKQTTKKQVAKTKRLQKRITHLTSSMNACQAIVKPDGSKPKVMKARGIRDAIKGLLKICLQNLPVQSLSTMPKLHDKDKQLEDVKLVWYQKKQLPRELSESTVLASSEFAGVKFRTHVSSGREYVTETAKHVIINYKRQLPQLQHLIICEEKYSFTPDTLKAGTRKQRQRTTEGVTHLKTQTSIIGDMIFDRDAVLNTSVGKQLISKYLAENIETLPIDEDLKIEIDSEFKVAGCTCTKENVMCQCSTFAVPIKCVFKKGTGLSHTEARNDIKQTKGEAEMSQVDWIVNELSSLKQGESATSFVTSGDIDAIVVHMFAISNFVPRKTDGTFANSVFVVLQSPNRTNDVYNITKIIEMLEKHFQDNRIGMKIALALCVGGNDFIPKLYGKSHSNILLNFLRHPQFIDDMFVISDNKVVVDSNLYKEFIKYMYCPKRVDPSSLTLDQVRKQTISQKSGTIRNPQMWMPPSSAIDKLAHLVQYQADYLSTAGIHDAPLPDVSTDGCFIRNKSGDIMLCLGPDVFMGEPNVTLQNTESDEPSCPRKRRLQHTPQKGLRRKFMTSTPIQRKHKERDGSD